MRETSDLYKALLADPAHVKECRLTIAGAVYDESRIVSLSTTEPLFAEDAMTVGGAVARELDFVAFLDDDVPRRALVVPEVRLVLGDQTSEWLQKGVFYIDTRSKDPLTGVTTVHGFDAMLMGEQEWVPAAADVFPMSMKDAVDKLLAILGVELDPRTTIKSGDAYTVDYPVTGQTIRQTLRWIAAAHGANWITNDLGQFRMVPLNALPGDTGYLVTETGDPITFGGVRILVSESIAGNNSPAGDNVFVGQRAAGAQTIPAMQPICRILLMVDDENAYVSESDTEGLTLEVSCPYGSQKMADDLLEQLQGYAYQPVQAEDALIDPAAELGDGVSVNGAYTILAQKSTTWDVLFAANIAAPGEAEIESEYGFTPSDAAEFNFKLAQTRSLIAKTAEQIRLSVEGMEGQFAAFSVAIDGVSAELQGLEGEYAALALTLDGLTVSGPNGSTLIAGSRIDTSTLNVQNINFSGAISFNDLTGTDDLLDDIDTALGYADEALYLAEDAADTVEGWRYNGGTYIDGAMIKAGTVMASMLIGGEVQLLTSAEREAGGLDITGSSTSSYAVELYSNGALRLEAYNGAAYLGADAAHVQVSEDGATIMYDDLLITLSNHIWVQGNMFPNSADEYYCGGSNYPWAGVWSTNGMCETSDRRKKKDIEYGLDKMDGFFDGLMPGSYRMVNGTSGRRHNGFVAQDVKENLDKHGIPTADFGGYVEDKDADGNPIYALRYSEFIPLLVDQVQKLKARVAELEEKKR